VLVPNVMGENVHKSFPNVMTVRHYVSKRLENFTLFTKVGSNSYRHPVFTS
jgi:hypothetical protein